MTISLKVDYSIEALPGESLIMSSNRKTAKDFFDSEEKEAEKIFTENAAEKESFNYLSEEMGKEKESTKDSDTSDKETSKSANEKSPVDESSTPTASYEQYVQQYHQYYAQYYSQYMMMAPHQHQPQNTQTVDPAYELFSGTATASTAPSTISTGMSFDAGRANRQMTAYFDPTKFQSALSPEMQAAQKAQKQQLQARLTAKEIEAFKTKKIEKKKAKNRWYYE